jgi:predicted transcriptional regulator
VLEFLQLQSQAIAMANVQIPDTLFKRLDRYAAAHGRDRVHVVKEALERQLDALLWWKREVRKGISQADAGAFVPAEKVMRRARALLARHGRKPATR